MNYPTLKPAEDFAGTLGGSKAATMIMDLVQEVRRVKSKDRQLRHDMELVMQRAESAERRLREIEARGLLT